MPPDALVPVDYQPDFDPNAGISIRPVHEAAPPMPAARPDAASLAQRFGIGQPMAITPQQPAPDLSGQQNAAPAQPSAPSGPSLEPVEHDPFEDLRISPRLPTGVKAAEDPMATPRLQIDMDAMKRDPEFFEHHANLVGTYPNVTLEELKQRDEPLVESFINHAKDNLLYLHDQVPQDIRPRSSLWYEGGNKIAHDFSDQYGSHPASSAAAIAALSPQKDWFMNVDLARRVHDINFTKANVPYSPQMEATAQRIFAKPQYEPLMNAIRGKTYGQLTDPVEKAGWLRLYDEAHNPRFHRLVTPEGNFGGAVLTQKGVPSGTGWGSLGEIAKAIQALDAKGDVGKISGLMGERHKVRSFYNNIIAPHAPHGDVTMDTHAVAAALLRPLSGNSVEVAHNFGNWPGAGLPAAKKSAVTGVWGTYPMYAEAYRRAAAERGILPRQMQSITWEAVRGLFPDTFKTKKNVEAVDNVWQQYRKGLLSIHDARAQILHLADGIRPPDWHGGSGSELHAQARNPAHAPELARDQLSRGPAERVWP